jgi:hypothetical protein
MLFYNGSTVFYKEGRLAWLPWCTSVQTLLRGASEHQVSARLGDLSAKGFRASQCWVVNASLVVLRNFNAVKFSYFTSKPS